MIAFSHLDFAGSEYFAPPLYSLLVAFTGFVVPSPFAVVDTLLFLSYLAVMLSIGARIYGRWITVALVVLTLAAYPKLTLDQWVIPWNTSLSAALVSLLFALFFHFASRAARWNLTSSFDWTKAAIFFVAYGAIFATRPLDVVVCFPMALVFFLKVLAANFIGASRKLSFAGFSWFCIIVAISGSAIPIGYLVFNHFVFGNALGGYFGAAGANGYFPLSAFRKAVSLLLDSSAYAETGQSLAENFWPAIIAFPTLVVSLFFAPLTVRIVSLTILLQFAIYMPYADLLPANLIRYMVVHYFKWTLPWMVLITCGQFVQWARSARGKRGGLIPVGASIGLSILLANLKVVIPDFSYYQDWRSAEHHAVYLQVDPLKQFDTIDIKGGPNSFAELMLGFQYIYVDERRLRPIADYRMFPAEWGSRIILNRPIQGNNLRVVFSPPAKELLPGAGVSRLGSQKIFLRCYVSLCVSQEFDATAVPAKAASPNQHKNETLRISFADTGNSAEFTKDGWLAPESWGRWTSEQRATLRFGRQAVPVTRIELEVTGLLNSQRSMQPIAVLINGCEVGRTTLNFPEDVGGNLITAAVPSSCTKTYEDNEVVIVTDRTPSPAELGTSGDARRLGVGVQTLSIW
ncbi:hypothetical protein C7G41_36225 [Bradyrhizobium sp. MOS002]|nr:hypothetical protein C7G41_36225 [Bradyrhizobium sp. MOS002]